MKSEMEKNKRPSQVPHNKFSIPSISSISDKAGSESATESAGAEGGAVGGSNGGVSHKLHQPLLPETVVREIQMLHQQLVIKK